MSQIEGWSQIFSDMLHHFCKDSSKEDPSTDENLSLNPKGKVGIDPSLLTLVVYIRHHLHNRDACSVKEGEYLRVLPGSGSSFGSR